MTDNPTKKIYSPKPKAPTYYENQTAETKKTILPVSMLCTCMFAVKFITGAFPTTISRPKDLEARTKWTTKQLLETTGNYQCKYG